MILFNIIIFFTILTGASAIFDIVKDCGCFGDALKLSPDESFIKDIVLLVLSSLIFYYRLYIFPVFSKQTLNSSILIFGACLSLGISGWGCIHLPLIDYRAYKTGNNLIEKMNDGIAPVFESSFIYINKKSGLEKEFDMKGLSNMNYEEWEWKETKNTIISEGKENSIHDFIIINEYDEDITNELLTKSDPSLLIISYDLKKADKEGFIKLAMLSKEIPDLSFYGLTNGTFDQNEEFRHETQAAFPFYSVDQTTLKTIIRSNPGLVLLKKGSVIGKWHINDMPDKETLLNYMK
ncbi:MAG TPA: DoxX family protein [Bacteroidetes bacterium]|nr:DoxX family protein [Bacteroidota bacterium]